MATRKDRAVLRQIRTLFEGGAVRELTDGQLLERFATDRGEAAELAFAVLVERHGPMVLRVCRGVLTDPHDTQDAFQATFLVLVQKARGLWVRDSLGPWLHQVAFRTATCARSAAARRRRHERLAAQSVGTARGEPIEELGRVLHEEIERLPECYREPVVLCDLGGRTYDQAARHLGWPVGTVKSRLSRGRERLRDRLRRRGLAPNTGLLATAPLLENPDALIPPALREATTSAAVRSAAARTIAQGTAASLAKGVLRTMFMTQWLKAASVLVMFGATVSGVGLLAQQGNPGGEAAPVAKPQAAAAADVSGSFELKPGPLSIKVIERGNVESAHNEDVYSRVEGQTTIMRIVPEGKRVAKGDLVCELDSASLKDQLINQTIATKAAEAAYQQSKLGREAAEIAVAEYEQGTFQQDFETVMGEIALATTAKKQAEARQERTRRARERLKTILAKKDVGAIGSADVVAEVDLDNRLDAAERTLQRSTFALEQAQTKRKVLEKYTRDKTVKQLKTEVGRKRSLELSKQAAWDLEKSKEAKLNRQIVSCKIFAPSDGVVVYANDPYRVGAQRVAQIEEGATVRERQKILSIPDLSAFVVNTKVREAIVDQLAVGNRAKVKVDAFPGETCEGEVVSIAPLPDPPSAFNQDIKVYTTRVKLDRVPERMRQSLRPGMTAESEILIAQLENVISVPLKSVFPIDNKNHVAVKKPDGVVELREVTLGRATLGMSNDESIEVKQGLKSGEVVMLNPRDLLNQQYGQVTLPAARKKSGAQTDQTKAKAKGK